MLQLALFLWLIVIEQTLASYCGQAAIPFTFQVLHSGQPVLGCARPKCFGWNADGTRAGDAAQFYRIDGKEDGYLRRSDQLIRTPFRDTQMIPQVAKCEEKFTSQGCARGQWLGGIAPRNLANGVQKLQVRCCSYAPLLESEDRGVAIVSNGQLVVGGEVLNGDELSGFDYISDITAETSEQGNTVYAVSIRRMQCRDIDYETVQVEKASISLNAVDTVNHDGQASSRNTKKTRITPQQPVRNAAILNTDAPAQYDRNLLQIYGMTEVPTSRYNPPPGTIGSVAFPSQQTLNANPPLQQSSATTQHYVPVQNLRTPLMGSYSASYYNRIPAPTQAVQPQPFGMVNNAPPSGAPSEVAFMQHPTQRLPQPHEQPSEQGADPIASTPFQTIPPLTFPTLDQIPKIDIPSVEDVESVIPPVQKAILTTVARFFGVL
ncbi:unnamed protein product [Cylicocyclus nassatus]|uniref:Uncharacterized protein n=1 Tax=Cylicocyclus nassatus TaxID=53992 RepID=A0AA36HGV0_CYLNA|nr:unnamed protein product [Cylicocyclus nassatus]